LAGDLTPDLDVFQHALSWLAQNEGFAPRLCVHLRPTCPVRDPEQIDRMIELLEQRVDLDSVRTVCPVTHPPHKMWYRSADGLLAPVAADLSGISEPWNVPRQQLPPTFIQTANIDVVRTDVITGRNSMTGTRIYGFLEDEFHDIDTSEELVRAAARLTPGNAAHHATGQEPVCHRTRSFCFDIDGVIATLSPENDYSRAQPQHDVIALINELYEAGHQITLFTARGYVTGIDWRDVTQSQLARWGVRYHELKFGKPDADYYVDDRMLPLDELAKLVHRVTEVMA
jgi:CMP-N-acetylneuraminic acid synthetase